MNQPPMFHEERVEVMHDLMRTHPLVSMISVQEGGIVADHIPLVIHSELSSLGTLRGHITRGNSISKRPDRVINTLAIFQGPQCYITPSWYASKKEHEKVVPTWNYIVVHAQGTVKFQEDAEWLLSHLTELTNRNEKDRAVPWKVTDAPDDFVARQLRGIIGVEIEISSLQGIWKTSQNKSRKDSQGVVEGLGHSQSQEANAMRLALRNVDANLFAVYFEKLLTTTTQLLETNGRLPTG